MVELLVTIVLAGIIFAAMVPLFATALKRTSADGERNDAQTIAVDRIEQVRLLNYSDITAPNLNYSPSPAANPFGDGRFGPAYTLTGGAVYDIHYDVTPLGNSQQVTVTVTGRGANGSYPTKMTTVVNNPAPNVASTSIDSGSSTPPVIEHLSITASFKNWTEVVQNSAKGVYWVRTASDGTTLTSSHLWPTDSLHTTVTWTELTGGSSYTYVVYCYSSMWNSGNVPFASPPFHLLKNARLKFDTNPGGS
jgi:type II secretory pathway pseudopilin PulG